MDGLDGIKRPPKRSEITEPNARRHNSASSHVLSPRPEHRPTIKNNNKLSFFSSAKKFTKIAVDKYTSLPFLLRAFALVMALTLLSLLIFEAFFNRQQAEAYNLGAAETLLKEPIKPLEPSLVLSPDGSQYRYNSGYKPGSEVTGQSLNPKFSADFNVDPNDGVTVNDAVNEVAVTLKPKFKTLKPKKDQNRLIYPLANSSAVKVYSLGASTIKEDILLNKFIKDDMKFTYELQLPEYLEPRMENDGSLGVYGPSNDVLLGQVSTGSDKDAELLNNARKNSAKDKLVFKFPAPFIVEQGKKKSNASAWFSLEGKELTIHAANLRGANYPLSIDPSVYIESARQLMKGNNETNIDFDIDNELIQKSQTTGARIDGWGDSTEMEAGVWGHSMAAAGGFVYRAGGRVDPTMPYVVGQQSSTQATNNANFVMNMPSSRPAGDLYLAIIAHDGTGAITPPAGWTEYADNQAGVGTTREHAAYWKIGTDQGGGNEAASYTFTGGSEQWTGVILRIKGFNSGSPISGTAGRGFNASDVVPVFPTTTPAHDATLVIRAVAVDADQPADFGWLPADHTKLYSASSSEDTANSAALMVASLDVPPLATNATGTTTLVNDGLVNDSYGASSIAIRPAAVTAGISDTVEWAQFNTTSSAIDSPNPGTGNCSGWCTNSDYHLPSGRIGMSLTAYNGYLYAIGGSDGSNRQTNVWIAKLGANGEPQRWHPTDTNKNNWVYWYSDTPLTNATSYHAAYAYNNRIYLLGGQTTASAGGVTTVESAEFRPNGTLNGLSNTGMQALPDVRHGHSVHVYNDVMYLIGGNSNGTLRNTVYYSKLNSDGTMNSWVQTNSFTTARTSFGGTMTGLWGGYIYLAGGCTALTSGYCSTVAGDVQLASINADGTIAEWNTITNLSNKRIGYNFIAWQNGLYRFGGCNRQNTTSGVCYATHRDVEFGVINQDGDASTVSNSEPANTAPCSGASPVNCDLPGAGDGAQQVGQMASSIVINNGYIYVIGGCTNVAVNQVCENNGTAQSSGNVAYAVLDSQGRMAKPATCPGGTFVTNSLWCVDSTRTINGTTGISAASATVFNNVIYVAGGTNGSNWQKTVRRVSLNNDGSLAAAWATQDMTTDLGLSGTADDERGYMYVFARANPAAAGSNNPGNFYMLGGCRASGGATGDGIGCGNYYTDVIKCNIGNTGALNTCSTSGQLQIDADNINSGSQGLGLMAGTIYANRIYLVGGACTEVGSANDPCGSNYSGNRKDTIYARIDNSNNIVAESGGVWQFTTGQMNPVRRRAVAFGYNGYIYSLAGYSGSASLRDLLFAKIDVSTGDMGNFSSSGVVVTPRWDLKAVVSNGYVYAIGGCGAGAAPSGCTSMQAEIQTFQLYNNDSGTPASYTALGDDTFNTATDRIGASAAVLNGYIYVAGGCTNIGCTVTTTNVQYASLDASNGTVGTWLDATNGLPLTRAWGQLEVAGGNLYYLGGQDNTAANEQSTVYYAGTFSSGNISAAWGTASGGIGDTAAQAAQPRTKFGAAVWNNRIYVVGGLNGSAANTNTVYISPQLNNGGNIAADSWTQDADVLNVARRGNTVVTYANNIYSFGGNDGTNYFNDSQFAKIDTADGSIGSWSYTTSLPTPISEAEGFAYNGYMYVVGGRSAASTCVPNTIMTPISANTTIASGNNPTGLGEWYETNQKYTGDRYGAAVAYAGGKLVVLGGGCSALVTTSRHWYSALKAQPQMAKYSRLIDTDTNVFPTKWLMNGVDNSIGAKWQASYKSAVDASNVVLHQSYDDGTNGNDVTIGNSAYDLCYKNGNLTNKYSNSSYVTSSLSMRLNLASGTGNGGCADSFDLTDVRYDRFYIKFDSPAGLSDNTTIYHTNYYNGSNNIISQLRLVEPAGGSGGTCPTGGCLQLRDQVTQEALSSPLAANTWHRIEVAHYNDQMLVRTFEGTNLHGITPSQNFTINLGNSPYDSFNSVAVGVIENITGTYGINIDEHKASASNWLGPAYADWGQVTNFGDVTLGTPNNYIPLDINGVDTEFARWYSFTVNIDASRTFGYPEDVNRGPTIADLSLFFTADPNKRMRHGKTFTGGELQPLDTPF